MDTSFYTAVRGAMTQQTHMDILSNNIANLNTNGYRTKNASFLDLMYYNIRGTEEEMGDLRAGTGAVVQRTESDFTSGVMIQTGGRFDYAIQGNGFFMLRSPVDNSVVYTRDGSFALSQRDDGFYLVDAEGWLVLDAQQNPIRYDGGELGADPAIFDFITTNGMLSTGSNRFVPTEKNGQPFLAGAAESRLKQGALESSNGDLAQEMSKVIVSQRAYSYMLRMIQTSDEVEQTINGLRR